MKASAGKPGLTNNIDTFAKLFCLFAGVSSPPIYRSYPQCHALREHAGLDSPAADYSRIVFNVSTGRGLISGAL
ncbi:hypothetical protein [Paraburkholderia sp. A1RO-1]|uniref:hypothetical protein n=1 Tax=unclassified Paraburkholderia TaxID=2615204 RepID=UPI003B81AE83